MIHLGLSFIRGNREKGGPKTDGATFILIASIGHGFHHPQRGKQNGHNAPYLSYGRGQVERHVKVDPGQRDERQGCENANTKSVLDLHEYKIIISALITAL